MSAALQLARLSSLRCPAWTQAAARRAYHQNVIDHFERPRNVGSFSKNDPNVGTGLVGAPACGDVMKLQIRVDEATGTIVEARFKTFGCGSAIASSSLVTEMVKGLALDDAGSIKNSQIAKELSLPPVKLHCSKDAIKAAISDYRKKRAAPPPSSTQSASSASV
ncbi:iron-binding protein [Sorochytrium milnesiophthora]